MRRRAPLLLPTLLLSVAPGLAAANEQRERAAALSDSGREVGAALLHQLPWALGAVTLIVLAIVLVSRWEHRRDARAQRRQHRDLTREQHFHGRF